MQKTNKLDHLQQTFRELTEMNQQYVLGLIIGLKFAQSSDGENQKAEMSDDRAKQDTVLNVDTSKN